MGLVNFIKKSWSHISPVHIESRASEYNKDLHVFLNKGEYMLCADNAIYSYGKRYYNYDYALAKIAPSHQDVKETLILGYGMGSIPLLMEQHYPNTTFNIDGVEIDDTIVYFADKYENRKLRSQVNMHTLDATTFVKQCNKKYDLICIDIFIDDYVPTQFESSTFLTKIKTLLAPNGLILFNRLYHSAKAQQATDSFYNGTFKAVFPTAGFIEVKQNRLLTNKSL